MRPVCGETTTVAHKSTKSSPKRGVCTTHPWKTSQSSGFGSLKQAVRGRLEDGAAMLVAKIVDSRRRGFITR